MQFKTLPAALMAAGLALSGHSHATNGMIMEGYGPVATALGGAAMAYDNGNAAMANNPATLALMAEGSRLDLALGFIGPDVKSANAGASSADAFYMPAFGYVKKEGKLSYGIGIYAQGGMGTEYANDDMAQVGVGRVIFPLAYNVNERLSVGGSVDVVWAGMDLVFGNAGIDVKDSSDYTGKMKAYGLAAKLGFTYKATSRVTVGGVYQTAGNLNDLKGGGYKMTGFDMPPILALGVAWQTSDRLMIAADIKDVMWNATMNTPVVYGPGPLSGGTGPGFKQDWSDQIVVSLGAAYKFNDAVTGRVGVNFADNPIPTGNMNYLWPAIIEQHYTVGLGYAFDKTSELNVSVTYAPEATQMSNSGVIEHSQTNWQLMYSKRF